MWGSKTEGLFISLRVSSSFSTSNGGIYMYSLYFKVFLLESLFCNLNPPVTLDKSRFMNHEVGLDFITVPRRLDSQT